MNICHFHLILRMRNTRQIILPGPGLVPYFCLDVSLDCIYIVYKLKNTPRRTNMADTHSLDIVCKVEMHEVKNAVDQARKQLAVRYDFKGSKS